MSIQTQKFTPLKARHYELAETETQKDAAMERQMQLQQQRINANAQQANMKALNTANLANQRVSENKKVADVNAENESYRREQLNVERGREDERIAQSQEKEKFRREQLGLNKQRTEKLDKQNLGLAIKQQESQDYLTNRQKEEDKRVDALRQKKESFKNKTLALGSVGLALSDAVTAKKYIDETDRIDLSDEIDALKLLSPNHSWKGRASGVISGDGKVLTLMDDDNVVMAMNGKSPVAVKISSIQQAKRYAESEFERQLTNLTGKGDKTAIKEAFSKFKTFEKMSVDANKVLSDMQFEGDASESELNRQADKVEMYSNKAGTYYNMSENNIKDINGYNLSPKEKVSLGKRLKKDKVQPQKGLANTSSKKEYNVIPGFTNKRKPKGSQGSLKGDVDVRSKMIKILEEKIQMRVDHLDNKKLAELLKKEGITQILGREIK